MKILQHCFRVYAESHEFENRISFYEGLQNAACERRIFIPETNVRAAKVGAFLILAGDAEQLETVRYVSAVLYVDSLDVCLVWLRSNGAEILHGPLQITAGRNLTARHPDGLVAEYFEAAK